MCPLVSLHIVADAPRARRRQECKKGLAGLRGAASPAAARAAGWPAEIEAARIRYAPCLEQIHEDVALRAGDLEQWFGWPRGFASRASVPTHMSLDPLAGDRRSRRRADADEDYRTVSTVHSAKGLEWRSVFLLSCVEGGIPSDRHLDTGGNRGGAAAVLCGAHPPLFTQGKILRPRVRGVWQLNLAAPLSSLKRGAPGM